MTSKKTPATPIADTAADPAREADAAVVVVVADAQRVQQLDPRTLVVDANIRHQAQPSRAPIASCAITACWRPCRPRQPATDAPGSATATAVRWPPSPPVWATAPVIVRPAADGDEQTREAGRLWGAARDRAWARWQVLAPAVQDGVALARAAAAAGVPLRTAQRWLARYRTDGLVGLARAPRADRGLRRTHPELVALVEGLALVEPRLSVATIARRAARGAEAHGWPTPSYSTVRAIVAGLDPQLATLAHDGTAAWLDRFELALRRQSEHPNDIWQADHPELDIEVLDAEGAPARPWLTVVLDDCSRAVAGYTVFLGAPSAHNLSLALRQAIWTKTEPGWAVHGLPEVLYADHGSDFISDHVAQVCVDLHIALVHSAVGRPQGRGKVERFLGTVTTELLPELSGHLVRGRRASPPALTVSELDAAIGRWITSDYHQRVHSETGHLPQQAWLRDGWLPRTPDSLEDLDLLLVMVATARTVHRDGILKLVS